VKPFRILKYALIIILLTSFQASLCQYLKIFSVMPNIVIAFVLAVSVNEGPIEAGIVGLICGIITDFLSSGTIVINSISYMYLPIIFGYINISFFRKNVGVTMLFSGISAVICEASIQIFHFAIAGKSSFFYMLFVKILPIGIYTAISAIPIYYLTVKLFGQKDRRDILNWLVSLMKTELK